MHYNIRQCEHAVHIMLFNTTLVDIFLYCTKFATCELIFYLHRSLSFRVTERSSVSEETGLHRRVVMEGLGRAVVLPSTSLQTRRMQAALMHSEDVARTATRTLMAARGRYSSTIQVYSTQLTHTVSSSKVKQCRFFYCCMCVMQVTHYDSCPFHSIPRQARERLSEIV